MKQRINKQWLMAKRPSGLPNNETFELKEAPVAELSDGQIMTKTLWLSLDPYMRGRMLDRESYAPPLQEGEIIVGETIGIVVESKSDKFAVGDHVCVQSGWQTYYRADDNDPTIMKIDPLKAPLQSYLGVVGMPGRTAYFGLFRVGKPKKGETVVVSAASGAVGSVVGQLAKAHGCRTVGIAGGPDKCSFVKDELGLDACVDYKAGNLAADLKAACPEGIDVYFENVGGAVSKAVAPLLNPGARVPICGFISLYNTEEGEQPETPFDVFGALDPVPEHRFFLVFAWMSEWGEATHELAALVRDGKLKYRETIVDGFEKAPEAFLWLFSGKNFGKLLVKVA